MDVVKYLKDKKNINFTDEQIKVVRYVDGPNLTLAVPGAGKTTCLVARTANLVLNHGIDPKSILTITFSKASSLDMKHRFLSLFGDVSDNAGDVSFSTIHAFAYRIVRQVHKGKTLIDSNETPVTKAKLVKNIYNQMTGEYMEEDKLEEISTAISYVKNKMLELDELSKEELSEICSFKEFKDVYNRYERIKKDKNYIDFDDMLTLCHEKLKSDSHYLNLLRNRFRYIQVDEAQDTSTVQFAIVELLARPRNNIFFLGDINQGIMSFRASDIRYLLDFKKKYPEGSVYTMSRNFRSTKDVVDVANRFIKKNTERYDFDMYTEKENDRPINIVYARSEEDELEHIVDRLKGVNNLSDSAVLFRNNISCIPLIDRLSKEDIPFYVRDHDNRFFTHWVVSDIKAFIKLAMNENDFESLSRIYYKSNLYINKAALLESKKHKTDKGSLYALTRVKFLRDDQRNRVYEFVMNMKRLRRAKGRDILRIIRKDLRYEEYILKNSEDMGYSSENLLNLISIFSLIVDDCTDLSAVLKKLSYLEELIKSSSRNKGANVVTLSTMHGSKGLEWENVYVMSLNDGIFPSVQASKLDSKGDSSMMEEERRLCYVAITRGKRYVDLLVPRLRAGKEVYPSRFVWEIEKSLEPEEDTMESDENIWKEEENFDSFIDKKKMNPFELRQKVKHKKFGEGIIIDINKDEDYLVINFASFGLKKIVLSLAATGLLERIV